MKRSELLKETLCLLDKDIRSLLNIANDTKLGYHWLSSLKQRKIREPSVNKIEILYKYLSGKSILSTFTRESGAQ